MDLSVREVATLLGRSSRTVRAQLARGELAGVKRNGRWRIARHNLALTDAQRRSLQGKADTLRQAVEDSLPSRMAATPGQRSRSVADLDAFRCGARLLAALRMAGPEAPAAATFERVAGLLEQALLALAEAVQQYDRELKLAALHRTRAGLAHCVAILLLEGGIPPREPLFSWVVTLETELIPAVAGFSRWADGLRERRR
jgi:hypothetical protein